MRREESRIRANGLGDLLGGRFSIILIELAGPPSLEAVMVETLDAALQAEEVGDAVLAASDAQATAAMLVNHYARRWTIEPQFRDTKDLRFGMGLSATRIGEPMRRDRLLLVSAFAMALLTLLGAVGERLGMDRLLKSNTSKTRSHSLFRQGCMLYDLIPTMPEHRLAPLIAAFNSAVAQTGSYSRLLARAE